MRYTGFGTRWLDYDDDATTGGRWEGQQVGTGCPIVLAGGGPIAEIFVDALGREGREASVLSAEEVEAGTITGLRTLLDRVGTPFPGRLDSL